MGSIDDIWATRASRLIKSLLSLEGITYGQLSDRLRALGVDVSESSLSNRINGGKFGAAFLLQVMTAIKMKHLTVPDYDQ
jgi:hypothetical protein